MVRHQQKRRQIGLALGAGAARGTAHLGVLKAFDELEIPVDFVAGTSIGSLVGGVYASGQIERLEEALLGLDWKEIIFHFFEVSFPRSGLIDGKRIVEFISQFINPIDIDELTLPFHAVATEIMTGEEVVLKNGPLIECIRASIAMPGIFTPVLRDGLVLVDGGLVNPVPVSIVREMGADFVIAVDINANRVGARQRVAERINIEKECETMAFVSENSDWRDRVTAAINAQWNRIDHKLKDRLQHWTNPSGGPNIIDVIGNTIRIMETQIGETMLKITAPDIVIRPDVGHFSFMEFNRAAEGIQAGYEAAKPILEARCNEI